MASESGLGGGDSKAVGGFELSSELHKGYFGALWIGRASSRDDDAGLVFARRIELGGDVGDGAASTVEQAVERALAIQHEKLVSVVEAVRGESELVIVSEYQAAEPVRALLRLAGLGRKPVPPGVAARMAIDVLEACVALHENDVLASLSPDNILVGADGVTRVLEPVVSHAAAQEAVWKEQPKRAIYAAPEQFGDDAGDARSDVFSLGVILWEMLRNRALFGGATYVQVSERVRTAAIGRADALKPAGGEAIPKPLADVVEKALQRKPEARFASAAEMLAELRSCQPASQAEVARFARELLGEAFSLQERKAAAALRAGAAPSRRTAAVSARPAPPMKSTPAPAPVAKKREAKKTLVGMAAPTSLRFEVPTDPSDEEERFAEQTRGELQSVEDEDDGIDVDTSDDDGALDHGMMEDDAPRARSSRRSLRGRAPSGYDVMSIADDPSIPGSLDEEAEAALRRVRQAPMSRRGAGSSVSPVPTQSSSVKIVAIVAAVVVLVGVAVIVGMKLGGGSDAARAGASALPVTAPTAAAAPVEASPSAVATNVAAAAPATAPAATSEPSTPTATAAPAAPAAAPPANNPAPAKAPATRPAPALDPYAAPVPRPTPAPAKPTKPSGAAKPSFNPYDI